MPVIARYIGHHREEIMKAREREVADRHGLDGAASPQLRNDMP